MTDPDDVLACLLSAISGEGEPPLIPFSVVPIPLLQKAADEIRALRRMAEEYRAIQRALLDEGGEQR